MPIAYVPETPGLKRDYKARSGSNASELIRFDDNAFSLVAVVDDQPVALIVAKLRPLSEPLQMEREAYLDIIEVQPNYQRQGIGTELMRRVTA